MNQNSQGVVPILSKEGAVIGLWARNPDFQVSRLSLAELFLHAEGLLQAFSHSSANIRRINNTSLTILENNIFSGGVLLMMRNELSPVEAMSQGLTEFGLLNMGGGIGFMHATKSYSQKFSSNLGRFGTVNPTPPQLKT